MKFEEIRSTIRMINAPEMGFNIQNHKELTVDGFIQILKKLDARDKKTYLVSYIIYMAFTISYLTWFFISFNGIPLVSILARISVILAFTFFSFYLRTQFRLYRFIDYAVPPVQFLQGAKERNSFWSKKLLLLIPFILFVDFGVTVEFSSIWAAKNPFIGLLVFQLIVIGFFAIGLIIGRKVWKKERADIMRTVTQLIDEFQD